MRQGVHEVSGWLLHATAWKETSIIAQVLTEDYGVVTVVARGAKRPYAVNRAILSAFTPLLLSWKGQGEVKNLTHASTQGFLPIGGKQLMPAWYLNELILYFLPKEDPHPEVYALYTETLSKIASGARIPPLLRRFEWEFLQHCGYGLDEAKPDFEKDDPALRIALSERIKTHMDGRNLRTRRVLHALHRLQEEVDAAPGAAS